jgi:RimJ/RimL family protein N-acetyltransferase
MAPRLAEKDRMTSRTDLAEPVLETERLRLRPLGPDDVDHLHALDGDPRVRRYVEEPRAPTRAALARAMPGYLATYGPRAEPAFRAAEDRRTGAFLGWFHLRPAEGEHATLDLGYRLRREAWGRGYATEGAMALVRRAFERLGAERVVAHALAANRASLRVLQKAGLHPRERYLHRGEVPALRFALERDEFLRRGADGAGPGPG